MAAILEPSVFFIAIFLVKVTNGENIIDYDNEDYDYTVDENEPIDFNLEEDEDLQDKEEKPCPSPASIRHGTVSVWGGGILLEYECDKNYHAVGATHGACDFSTGQWTIEPPLCVEMGCPNLPAPNRGVVNTDSTGGVATFTCRQGYHLIGSPMLLCEGGRWTGIYPFCAVNPEPNTTPLPVTDKDVNSTIPKATKDDISLLDSDESCFHNHVEPPVLENAAVDISYVMNEIRGRYVMLATYTCFPGFKFLNDSANKLYCRNLKWGAPDIPKCVSENDPCQVNNGGCEQLCVSGENSFACTCYSGYTLGSSSKDCIDIDECAIENGGCEQECHNTHASYFCSCFPGYVAKGPSCVDVDECLVNHSCPGDCINTPGSWQCNCSFPGYRPSSVPTVCEDIDECSENRGGCADVCINRRGSYSCRCEERGRKLAADNHSCEDIDECKRYKLKVCRHGACYNTDGSYVCTCKAGFYPSDNDSSCGDVDECTFNNGGCQQVCKNTLGTYNCACLHGYTLGSDSMSCVDVDECRNKNGGCEDKCINTAGSFSCVCTKLGLVLAADNRSCSACEDVYFYDDSTQTCRPCPAHAHSMPGKMALAVSDCVCDVGFRRILVNVVECVDIDECSDNSLLCSHTCVNTPGSANCACPKGYALQSDGKTCQDVDECLVKGERNTSCNHVCLNTLGSYKCECHTGGFIMDLDGHTCIDVDECLTDSNNCTHGCINTQGGFTCKCPPGFYLNDVTYLCEDVNECFLDKSPCQHTCNNTIGSYECGCFGIGFRLSKDQSSCIDINECMEGDNPCPDICINTIGSYMCDCDRKGYRLAEDSSGCLDIDECEDEKTHGCEQVCVNLPGSFSCDCHPGYRRVGLKGCQACPVGMYRPVSDSRCQRCPALSNTNGTAKSSLADCICEQGYIGNPGNNVPCVDVDECTLGNFGCQHRCINTVGSALCACSGGFRLSPDKKSCDDVDECSYSKGRCHQVCINTAGSYVCGCEEGYTLNANGYSCNDLNECEMSKLVCEHRCINTRGSARCVCSNGYQLLEDGTSCGDANECANSNGGCDDVCVNTEGSYLCKCTKPGFTLSRDNRQCVDINECINKSLCEGYCENLYGSYRCHCSAPGFLLAPDNHNCQDVDECHGKHSCQQYCVNTQGSYRCECFSGFFLNNSKCIECPIGTFKNETSSCEDCPPNMTTLKSGATSRSLCQCKAGYSIHPSNPLECIDINECAVDNGGCEHVCQNSPGNYSCSCRPSYKLHVDERTCFRYSCSPLSPPANGLLFPPECKLTPSSQQNNWLIPGTVCSYECDRGYVISGEGYRTCDVNGSWTGDSPSCKPKTCGGLQPPVNGFVLPRICVTGPVPFRKRCKFRCNKGFRLQGRSGAKCLANQRWSTTAFALCVPRQPKSKPFANESSSAKV